MKIGIVTPMPVPYVFGGAERLWRGLADYINASTPHEAELVMCDSPERTLDEIVDSYERFSTLDVSRYDLVVSTKYPAWMVEHPRHVVYLQHTLRGLYDTYPLGWKQWVDDPPFGVDALLEAARRAPDRATLPELFERFRTARAARNGDTEAFDFPGPLARELVQSLDAIGLDPTRVRAHLAISRTVAMRSSYFPPACHVEPIHHPSDLTDFRCAAPSYFFTASRIDGPKRIDLLVRAMEYVYSDVALKIAGTGPDLDRVRELADADDRIEFVGHVTEEELLAHYAASIAVPFVPFDEDLGLITLEAMMSSKPVVTTSDSGGPTELVGDGSHGFVVAPSPEALGAALDRLAASPALAADLGVRARARAERVTWDHVVDGILRAGEAPVRQVRRTRNRLVVASTFPVHPAIGGGQLRCHHLYGSLAPEVDVEMLSLTAIDHPFGRVMVRDGFSELQLRKSPEHHNREVAVERQVGMPITDIAASALTKYSTAYVDAMRDALDGASGVILAHPFLYPVVRSLSDLPVVYDAMDAVYSLKDSVLPDNASADALRDMVLAVEGATVRDAAVVTVCSEEDEEDLRNRYGDREFVRVANGVDAFGTEFVIGPERRRRGATVLRQLNDVHRESKLLEHIALFVGSYHPPNIEAVAQIIAMADELPDVAFLVVGSVCHRFFDEAVPHNVFLLGVVSDMEKRRLLGAADVALNPMLLGAGTNLKVIEYFAAGVPTISTPTGARGLKVEWHRDVAVVPIEEFPAAIHRVLDHSLAAAAMAQRARRIAVQHYDWRVLAAGMLDSLRAAIPALRDPQELRSAG